MKDKRQRQTTPWPIDPNFLTLMVHQLAAQQNAAAQIRSNPWPFGQAYNQPAAGKNFNTQLTLLLTEQSH